MAVIAFSVRDGTTCIITESPAPCEVLRLIHWVPERLLHIKEEDSQKARVFDTVRVSSSVFKLERQSGCGRGFLKRLCAGHYFRWLVFPNSRVVLHSCNTCRLARKS